MDNGADRWRPSGRHCHKELAKTTDGKKVADDVTGYTHPSYADALSEFGSPRILPRCRGWLLQRQIPESEFQDAMGCYPLFSCADWSQLQADLEDISADLVSVALVADPFGEHDPGYLKTCFRDVVIPFKDHFVTDLTRAPQTFLSEHHRRNARKALQEVTVQECANATPLLDDWCSLYANLKSRHEIRGITSFSRESFAKQLAVPGLIALRALRGEETVGITLWYTTEQVAYYHLGAYSDVGYELRASFALFSHAIDHFGQRGLHWLNLGAAPGAGPGGESGLNRFKKGWSTGMRTAYFCGRIFDREKYDTIREAKKIPATNYFPAYRLGEFS